MEFLNKYEYTNEALEWKRSNISTRILSPDILLLDSPLHRIRDLHARVATRMHVCHMPKPSLIIANEGGGPLAILIALGWNGEDILNSWDIDKFDIEHLIVGKSHLPEKIRKANPVKDPDLHKGHRLRDAIDDLLRQTYNLGANEQMTLQRFAEKSSTLVAFHAYDFKAQEEVLLSKFNYPFMPVSVAMLATMANGDCDDGISIREVEWSENKKTIVSKLKPGENMEKFCSASRLGPHPPLKMIRTLWNAYQPQKHFANTWMYRFLSNVKRNKKIMNVFDLAPERPEYDQEAIGSNTMHQIEWF